MSRFHSRLDVKRGRLSGIVKSLALVLTFGWCAPALAAVASENVPRDTQIKPLPPVNGHWCQSADGNWVWIATGQSAKPPRLRPRASETRRNPVGAPTGLRDRFRPDSVNGIFWFLDGRSYFSD